jgi:CRP-like cAMP-binding protein
VIAVQQCNGVRHAPAALESSSPLSGTRLLMSHFLSRDEQHALDAVAEPARTVRPNVDLVREGEGAESLFVITRGWACRYATTREGGRQFPALVVPGDIGNLDSLMFDRIDYGVRTLTEATVVALPRQRALELMAQHPGIAQTFVWLGLVENANLSEWALSLGLRTQRAAGCRAGKHEHLRLSADAGADRRHVGANVRPRKSHVAAPSWTGACQHGKPGDDDPRCGPAAAGRGVRPALPAHRTDGGRAWRGKDRARLICRDDDPRAAAEPRRQSSA